jgi:arylformamidase
MNEFDWRTATPEEVDYQYSPSQFARRPLAEYLAEYVLLSENVDVASMRAMGTPLLIFIHGGYWQSLSARDSLYNANDARDENISLHAVEYTLAPHASIPEIIDECIADVKRTLEQLQPTSVVIAGFSAGAHLAAMCVRDPDIASRVNGVALLSGIFDLRPLVRTPTNIPLHLTEDSAADISPQLLPFTAFASRALLAVGIHESSEFIRQNAEYANYLRGHQVAVEETVVDHRDHFDLPYDLLRKGTQVGDWCLNILKGNNS